MDEIKAPQAAAPDTTAAPASAPESTQTTEQTDPRLEQLARRERALRQQARAFQEEKRRFEEDQKRVRDEQGRFMSHEDWKKKFLSDPTSVGLTYEEIAQRYLHQPSPEEQRFQAYERKIAELEAKLSGTEQKISSSQEQAYQQAVKQISREVSLLVDGNDAFETIKATGSQEAVVALIERTYKEDGILLTAEEAAKQVEDYLLDEALKLANLNKVKAKLTPAQEAAKAEAQEATIVPQKPTSPIPTLSHAATASQAKPLSAKERRQRAILAFQGKLTA